MKSKGQFATKIVDFICNTKISAKISIAICTISNTDFSQLKN